MPLSPLSLTSKQYNSNNNYDDENNVHNLDATILTTAPQGPILSESQSSLEMTPHFVM